MGYTLRPRQPLRNTKRAVRAIPPTDIAAAAAANALHPEWSGSTQAFANYRQQRAATRQIPRPSLKVARSYTAEVAGRGVAAASAGCTDGDDFPTVWDNWDG